MVRFFNKPLLNSIDTLSHDLISNDGERMRKQFASSARKDVKFLETFLYVRRGY